MKLYRVTVGAMDGRNYYIVGIPYFLHPIGEPLERSGIAESILMECQWNRPLMVKPRKKR